MKDTPAGVGGSEGIAAPPGPWAVVVTSIMAKPAWAAMEGMAMGIPCCMTAEPGGEEPPGGKKTWLMAPEDMHGLAFAIQRAVCRLYRGAQVHKDMPRCRPKCRHTLWAEGPRFLLFLCPPPPGLPVGEKESLIRRVRAAAVDVVVFSPPPPSHYFFFQLASVGWLLLLPRRDKHERRVPPSHKVTRSVRVQCVSVCVWNRERGRGVRKGGVALLLFLLLYHHHRHHHLLPSCLSHLQKAPAERRKSKLGLWNNSGKSFFVCFCFVFLSAALGSKAQNGFHEQETVRMRESKSCAAFTILPCFSFSPSWVSYGECVCVSVRVRVCGRLAYRQGASLFPIPLPPAALFCRQPSRKWSDWHGLQPIGHGEAPPPFLSSILPMSLAPPLPLKLS